jgi:uncharacterized membrane-anchored protein YhcB (DUF1043 family)
MATVVEIVVWVENTIKIVVGVSVGVDLIKITHEAHVK